MEVAELDREIEKARARGPVRDILIPPCPDLLIALRAAMGKSDPEPADIVAIASSDVAMAAALIRVANSPLYARSRTAQTVGQAVTVLGVTQTSGVLTGFLTRNALPVQSPLLEHFWETSTRRALAMGFIARQLYGVDPEIAHTCGLFIHVGIPILLQGVKGYAGTLTEALARMDRSFTATENAAHRTDHAVIGAIVARTWHLPPVIALAIRLHHDFGVWGNAAISAQARNLVAIALLADTLVAQHEGVPKHQEWQQYGTQCLAHLQINESEVRAWDDALHPLFESVALG